MQAETSPVSAENRLIDAEALTSMLLSGQGATFRTKAREERMEHRVRCSCLGGRTAVKMKYLQFTPGDVIDSVLKCCPLLT